MRPKENRRNSMSNLQRFALSCAALLWAGVAQAGFVTVDFDPPTFPTGMTNTPGLDAIPPMDRLSNFLVSDGGVNENLTFSTVGPNGNSFVALVNLGTGHAPTGINAIGAAITIGPAPFLFYPTVTNPIQVAFSVPTNSVSITGDLLPLPPGSTITINAFNASNVIVATQTLNDTGGTVMTVTTGGPTIAYVQFYSSGSGIGGLATVGFDHLVVNVVPEPTSVVMGLGGFAGVLGMVRRHRRLARNSSAA